MLYTVSRTKGVESKREIGRFIIRANYEVPNSPELKMYNLDYKTMNGLSHPNVSYGNACAGTHIQIFHDAPKNFELYGLFDSIITFLTTWPHDPGATPYTSFTTWMRGKRKITPEENPFGNIEQEGQIWPIEKK
jgi:hypothetical protein